MQLKIEHFLVQKRPRSTYVWGMIQIRDPWFDIEVGLYTAPTYLIFNGNCRKELSYKVYPELTHWRIIDMIEQIQATGGKDFDTSQLHELDPHLEKKIAKTVMLARLKM
jgi:hypothetical protein